MGAFNLYFSNFSIILSNQASKTSGTSLVFFRLFTVTVSFLVPVVEIRRASLAKLTGQPRAVARAALDALNAAGKTEKLDSARFS